MSWVAGRGRPQMLPIDRTELRGPKVDGGARIAWLLRVGRMAHFPGPARPFDNALAARGIHVGSTNLSRYETGQERVPLSVVRGYERVLGLPGGGLVGLVYRLDRVFGPVLAKEPRSVPTRAELSQAAAAFEGYVRGGQMTGIRWICAARGLTHPSGVLLPPSLMSELLDRLVLETMRATGTAQIARLHALSTLLCDPLAAHQVADAIERAVGRPGAPSVAEVVSVLGDSSDPAVLDRLVGEFELAEGARLWGASYGLLTAIARVQLTSDLAQRVGRAALAAAGEGPERGIPAFLVARRLSTGLAREVVRRLDGARLPVGHATRIDSPAGLRSYVSAALTESGLDDRMLERLLREALSTDFTERQHLSRQMLRLSPYREVLADVALEQLTHPSDPEVAATAGSLLRQWAHPHQRDRLMGLLEHPRHHADALVALVQSGGLPPEVDLNALLDVSSAPADLVWAAGCSGHPGLSSLAAHPQVQHAGAASAHWWIDAGPGLCEESGPECHLENPAV